MAYRDLHEFIRLLEERGQLKRVKTPVSPELEITEITNRVSKGPRDQNVALLFENVEGHDVPVLINALGSAERMAWALGVERLDELTERLAALIRPELPHDLGETLDRARQVWGALRAVGLGPRLVKRSPRRGQSPRMGRAPCQEVVETANPSLAWLPILKCWPGDAGRYITLPTVITRHPVTGVRNVGMYRLQVHDERTLGMHWQIHKGGAEHERVAREMGTERVPVAVSLGGDPAVMWCGSAPLPPDVDELLLAGWLRGQPVPLVRCVTQPLEVPADAEIVIEGYVDPRESRLEGPFGDHTGYYTPPEPYPVMHVTAITHRREPIYPTTVVGRPPMEDYWMGKAAERLFLPLMRLFLPEIVDVNLPAEGIFHNLVLVSIKKRFPGHPRKVINGLWGMGLMMLAKCIVVLDAHVDVQNVSEAMFYALNNVDWARDVVIQEGPVDALDHASDQPNFGGKIGIDATAKGPADGYPRTWPEEIRMSAEVKALVDQKWASYGFGG